MSRENAYRLNESELERQLDEANSNTSRLLLQEQASNAKNPIIYHYRPNSVLEDTITDAINYWAPQPERLTKESALHQSVEKFYQNSAIVIHKNVSSKFKERKKSENIDKIYDAMLADSPNTYSKPEQDLIKKTMEFILSEYEGIMMKRKGFHTAEHSLHAAKLLSRVKGVQSQDIITALLHDVIEDTKLKKKQYGSVAAERGAITRASRRIYQALETGNERLDHKLKIATEATVIMTTKSWQDYVSYIDDVETKGEFEEEIRTSTMLAKMADKQTSMLTWEPFDSSDKLKQLGKAYLVINKAREFSNSNYERASVLEDMSRQLAGSIRRACDVEITNGLEFLKNVKKRKQKFDSEIILEPQRLSRAIDKGLLDKWEHGSQRAAYDSVDFAKTLHVALVLGSHPDREWESIPPILGTDSSENRRELLKEQRKYRLHHGDAKFTTKEQLEEEITKYSQQKGMIKARTRRQVKSYLRRTVGLRQLATKYAVEPGFYLEDE